MNGNEKISQWTDHIINHFWYRCSNCDGQESKLKVKKKVVYCSFQPCIIYCPTVPSCVNSLSVCQFNTCMLGRTKHHACVLKTVANKGTENHLGKRRARIYCIVLETLTFNFLYHL